MSDATLVAELEAVRSRAALFSIQDDVVEIRGRHAERFLHSMLSQDVKSMVPGAPGRYATFLTDTGKVVGVLLLLRLEERRFLAVMPAAAATVAALQRFVLAQDVVFTTLAAQVLSVQGPAAADLVGGLDAPFAWLRTVVGAEVTAVEHGRCGERGVDLLVEGEVAPVLAALRAAGVVEAGPAALDVARVEAGVPWLGRELTEDTIPLEAHLRHAISYKKGCYIGQETIAMTTYRGQPPRLLRGLRFSGGLPAPGLLTVDGRKAGTLTSAVESPELGPIGLALVKNKLAAPGTVVRVGERDAVVVELPFRWGTGLLPQPVDP
ncbi:MAG: aminomethyltransferase [Myxococcales bacterium]